MTAPEPTNAARRSSFCFPPSIAPCFSTANSGAAAVGKTARMTTSVVMPRSRKGHGSLEFFSLAAFLPKMVVNEALGFDDLEIDNPIFVFGAIRTVHDESPFAAWTDVHGMRGRGKPAGAHQRATCL